MSNLKSKWVSLIALLGFVSIESTADGSYFQTEHIDKIDAELESNKETITALNLASEALQRDLDKSNASLSAAQQVIIDLKANNTSLEQEVVRLNEVVARQPENNKSLGKTGEEGIEQSWIETSAGWVEAKEALKNSIY